jgi:hypothetical protein
MTRHSTNSTSDWLLGAVKQNPEGLLLLAAGAVLLLRSGGRGQPSSNGAPQASSRLAEAATDVSKFASDVSERTTRTAEAVASSVSEYATEATKAVGDQSQRMFEQAQSTLKQSVNRVLQEQPLAVAIAGLAAGAAVASAFPASNFEKETMGPIGEKISEAASRVGDELKEATQKAGETLKSAAEKRGLTKEGLKEVVSEAAEAFAGSMGGGADQTSRQGQPPQQNRPPEY